MRLSESTWELLGKSHLAILGLLLLRSAHLLQDSSLSSLWLSTLGLSCLAVTAWHLRPEPNQQNRP